jgi:hypothetical protein
MNKIFFTLLLCSSLSQFSWAGWKDEQFPNYFQNVPSEADGQKLLVEAFDSVARRLSIPYLDNGRLKSDTQFLKKMSDKVHAVDPQAKVYLAGGVVRSILGYVYQQLHEAQQKDPNFNTVEALKAITASKEVLPSQSVLGVGSDFDVLVDPSSPQLFQPAMHAAEEFILSAESSADLRSESSKLKHSLVPVADIKCYDAQVNDAFSQGGCALDLLGFDLGQRNFRFPAPQPNILKDFMRGEYEYLGPSAKITSTRCPAKESHDRITNDGKQTIRGLRPLLEIPFLGLTPNGEKQLTTEIKELSTKLKSGSSLSLGAKQQIEKLTRNARMGAAGNRFYRSPDDLEKTIRELGSSLIQRKEDFVPEFVDRVNPEKRNLTAEAHSIDAFLMTPAQFRKEHTNEGTLFHGTKGSQSVLGIIRNGLYLSKPEIAGPGDLGRQKQGTAVMGQGGYTSKEYETACGYSDDEGCVFRFELKPHPKSRILDFGTKTEGATGKIAAVCTEAKKQNRDCKEFLAREYGVDIIVDSHVLIQNAEVLKLPNSAQDLIRIEADSLIHKYFSKPEITLDKTLLEALKKYAKIATFGRNLGYAKVESPLRLFFSKQSGSHLAVPASMSDPELLLAQLKMDDASRNDATSVGGAGGHPRLKPEVLKFILNHFGEICPGRSVFANAKEAKKNIETLAQLLQTVATHPSADVRSTLPTLIDNVAKTSSISDLVKIAMRPGISADIIQRIHTAMDEFFNSSPYKYGDQVETTLVQLLQKGIPEGYQKRAIDYLEKNYTSWAPRILPAALLNPDHHPQIEKAAIAIFKKNPINFHQSFSSEQWSQLALNASPEVLKAILIDNTYSYGNDQAFQTQVPLIAHILARHPDPELQKRAVIVLRNYKGANGRMLAGFLKTSQPASLRVAAAQALENYSGDDESRLEMFTLHTSPKELNPEVRKAALKSLGNSAANSPDVLLGHFLAKPSTDEQWKATLELLSNYPGKRQNEWVRKALYLARNHPQQTQEVLDCLPGLFGQADPIQSKVLIKEMSQPTRPAAWRYAAAQGLGPLLRSSKEFPKDYLKNTPWISKTHSETDPKMKQILESTLNLILEDPDQLAKSFSESDQQKMIQSLKAARNSPENGEVILGLWDAPSPPLSPELKKLGRELSQKYFSSKYQGNGLIQKILTQPEYANHKELAYANLDRSNCYFGEALELFKIAVKEKESQYYPLIRDAWDRCLTDSKSGSRHPDHFALCTPEVPEAVMEVCLKHLADAFTTSSYSFVDLVARLAQDSRPAIQAQLADVFDRLLHVATGQDLLKIAKGNFNPLLNKKLATYSDQLKDQVFFYKRDILALRLKLAKDPDVQAEFQAAFTRMSNAEQEDLLKAILKDPRPSAPELALLKLRHSKSIASDPLCQQIEKLFTDLKSLEKTTDMDPTLGGAKCR